MNYLDASNRCAEAVEEPGDFSQSELSASGHH